MYTVPPNYVGAVLTCDVHGWPTVEAVWKKDGQSLHKGSGIVSEFIAIAPSSQDKTAILTWERGFTTEDQGTYVCAVHELNSSLHIVSQSVEILIDTILTTRDEPHRQQASTPCSVERPREYFQLRVFGTDCLDWEATHRENIADRFQLELLREVSLECGCDIDRDELFIEGVECSLQVGGAAVFHGLIVTDSVARTQQIFCTFTSWKQMSPAVWLDGQLKYIDSTCSTKSTAEFSTDRECTDPTSALMPGYNGIKEIIAASGSTCGFILVVALLIVIVSCVGCHHYRGARDCTKHCPGEARETDGMQTGDRDTYDQ